MRQYKVSKYLIVFAIVCLLLGGVFVGAGLIQGGSPAYLNIGRNSLEDWLFTGSFGKHIDDYEGEWSKSLGDVDHLEFDIELGNIEFIAGEKNEIQFINIKDSLVKIKNKGKKQVVEVKDSKSIMNLKTQKIIVTLKDYEYDLKLEQAMGNIAIDNLSFSVLDISNHLGDINIKNISAEEASIETDAGNIQTSAKIGKEIDVENHMGNINLDILQPREEYAITVSNTLGNTKIDEATYTGHAKIKETSSNKKMLKVDNKMGNITVEFR